jgi:hypothetical protein
MRGLLLVAIAGCTHYEPGSYALWGPWSGTRIALPCLDLAVSVAREQPLTGPVVSYNFGNRCDHDVTVDLSSASVVARDAQGRELHLSAYDPGGQIRPAALPALLTGSERIEYNGDFAERALVQVCVDVGAIDRSGDAQARWICSGDRLEAAR